MLTLERELSEEIVIGDNEIVIQIVRICGKTVRIGITAPPHMSIHRREIYEAKKAAGESLNKK